MKQDELNINILHEKIRKGLELTFKRLLAQKKAQNGTFVFSENGEIKKVKAADINC